MDILDIHKTETLNYKTTRLSAAKADVHRQNRLLKEAKLELVRREEAVVEAESFLIFCEQEMEKA